MSKTEKIDYPRQRPTVRADNPFEGGHERIIQEHPAYGRISLTHPSGGNVEMFGSDIPHNQRIALRIDLAYEETAYGIPNYRSQPQNRGGRVVELEMTAYQWANLVASHSGNGVPCTLRYLTPNGTGSIPLIEGQNTNEVQANKEIEALLSAMMTRHAQGVEALRALVGKGKANKKELTDALALVQNVHSKLPEVTAFAIETFKENSEVIVAKANAEVEATISNLVTRTGLKTLGMTPLSLEDKDE